MGTVTLKGQRLQDEEARLYQCEAIRSMAQDLYMMQVTSERLKSESQFGQLNDRYHTLTGNHGLTIGSVLNAVAKVLSQIETEMAEAAKIWNRLNG
jgi:hypothetical protein